MKSCPAYYEINLNSSLFWWTASIVRQRGHILDHNHFDSVVGKGAYRTFPPGSGTLYIYIHSFQTGIKGGFCCISGSHLSRIRSILFRPLETHFACAAPGNQLSVLIRDTNDNIVETRRNMCVPVSLYFYHSFFSCRFRAGSLLCFCHFSK